MGLREWWNRLGEEDYENYEEEFKKEDGLMVRVFDVKGETDADEIIEAILTGKVIALINSKHVKDGEELKNVILRVKEVTEKIEGKVVGLPERWFLVTPKEVGIYKKQEETAIQ
ncbi:MAG: cell division protein SepF [Candidatus Nanoarchaeia archaeon]